MKKQVLFLCTHNSARSQLAEGILRHLAKDKIDSYSAGTVVTDVNPMAIKVMKEKGIDISDQYSKHVKDFIGKNLDCIITVCDNARDNCPNFPGSHKKIHWSLADPGTVPGTDEDRLNAFRKTRDMLFDLIKKEFNL